ncbi:hypothetical protein, partial [Desulfobacter sp. UBA2225]|uniref:hypothetical protein n=1 Tax=Desulfobacter sp. UBA2225 TaxID=1961413 RepID=UPI00257D31CA
ISNERMGSWIMNKKRKKLPIFLRNFEDQEKFKTRVLKRPPNGKLQNKIHVLQNKCRIKYAK